jgi:hypothetical protein
MQSASLPVCSGNTTETQDADICKLFAGIVDECII